jgi:tripartite-type tricarboxylate transporter receptor subunit TctC
LKARFIASISISVVALGTGAALGQTTATGSGQAYPNKPIRILASEAGSSSDFTARLIAQGISGSWGQPVIVDNRTGIVAIETVAKAPPDGYTVFVYGATLWLAPLMQKTSYDPLRDFSPITIATSSPLVLAVHPSLPAKSIKELIALAKAKPGVLNYGSAAIGGPSHLAPELFKSVAGGIDIVRVNYKGTGPALNGLLGGEVHLMITPAGPVMPLAKAGKLRVLAITSAQPSALFPGMPTVAAAVPGYEFDSVQEVLTPAATPAAIVQRLNQEIVRVLNQLDVKQKFFDTGTEVVGSSPEQLTAKMKSEMAQLGKVIKDAGIKLE